MTVGQPATDVDDLDAEPVGDRPPPLPACTTSPTIAARDASSRAWPPYSAAAQRARSSAVAATEPAAPEAVTTEVKGATADPSDRLMAGRSGSAPVNR